MNTIGEFLRAARGEKTLGQIAMASGIDKGYLSKIERNERRPKPDMLAKLAQAYGVSYDELMVAGGYASPESELFSANPDIRIIARAGKKLSPEQAEQLRKYAQYMFPEAFEE